MSYLPSTRRAQGGVAAIEFALIILLIVTLMAAAYEFGRVTLQYNALQKATYDAARYLSSVPRVELTTIAGSNTAIATAKQMVRDAASAAGISLGNPSLPFVDCNSCGSALLVPSTMRVYLFVTLTRNDSLFAGLGFEWLPNLALNADITVPYAN